MFELSYQKLAQCSVFTQGNPRNDVLSGDTVYSSTDSAMRKLFVFPFTPTPVPFRSALDSWPPRHPTPDHRRGRIY